MFDSSCSVQSEQPTRHCARVAIGFGTGVGAGRGIWWAGAGTVGRGEGDGALIDSFTTYPTSTSAASYPISASVLPPSSAHSMANGSEAAQRCALAICFLGLLNHHQRRY